MQCQVAFFVVFATVLATSSAATAQQLTDLSGYWHNPLFEDNLDRFEGPTVGEWVGLPLNDASRRAAESWDAAILSVPEHQCQDYPADYASNSVAPISIWKEMDPQSHNVIAWRSRLQWMGGERTIWMDGRPRPSEDVAPHLARVLDGTLGARHIGRHDDSPQEQLAPAQRSATQRQGHAGRALHTARQRPDDRHDDSRPGLLHRAGRPKPRLHPQHQPDDVGVRVRDGSKKSPVQSATFRTISRARTRTSTHSRSTLQVPIEAARGGAQTMYPEYRTRLATLPIPPRRTPVK